jgi:hypothetical protein
MNGRIETRHHVDLARMSLEVLPEENYRGLFMKITHPNSPNLLFEPVEADVGIYKINTEDSIYISPVFGTRETVLCFDGSSHYDIDEKTWGIVVGSGLVDRFLGEVVPVFTNAGFNVSTTRISDALPSGMFGDILERYVPRGKNSVIIGEPNNTVMVVVPDGMNNDDFEGASEYCAGERIKFSIGRGGR